MSTIKTLFGTPAALTITIASLANGAGRAATAITNTSTLAFSADVRVKIKTNAAGTVTTGYVAVYLIRSEDGSSFDDAFGGSDAAFTPINSTLIGFLTANANATTYHKVFDLAQLGLTLPEKWSIGISNVTGAALDSTAGNHEIKYTEKLVQTA